jgi:hypothetical protein
MHTSLETILECPLAPATGVNLGFDHDGIPGGQGGERLVKILNRLSDRTIGHGYACIGKELFGLVFVNIHLESEKGRLTGKIIQSSLFNFFFFFPRMVPISGDEDPWKKRRRQSNATTSRSSCPEHPDGPKG